MAWPGPALGSTPRMPHTSRWKAFSSSSESWNSTHVVAARNVGKLLFRPSGAGQENGNHAKTPAAIADTLIDGRTNLFILPGAKTAGTHKNGASFRFGQGRFDGWLPGIARNQVPFVQPSLDAFLRESASQLFNGRFICSAMTKKDVECHFAAALPATIFIRIRCKHSRLS